MLFIYAEDFFQCTQCLSNSACEVVILLSVNVVALIWFVFFYLCIFSFSLVCQVSVLSLSLSLSLCIYIYRPGQRLELYQERKACWTGALIFPLPRGSGALRPFVSPRALEEGSSTPCPWVRAKAPSLWRWLRKVWRKEHGSCCRTVIWQPPGCPHWRSSVRWVVWLLLICLWV